MTKRHLSMMRTAHDGKFSPRSNRMVFSALMILCLLTSCRGRATNAWVEEARATSPDGKFDAVMTRESTSGGALGSLYWNIFIVPKGDAAPRDEKHSLFRASVLRGENLVWKRPHLLEVRYDIAEIQEFRNIWGENEVQDRGWRKGDYLAELRLLPSSPDFSLLTADGDIKPKD
jgi:hypothetical protein